MMARGRCFSPVPPFMKSSSLQRGLAALSCSLASAAIAQVPSAVPGAGDISRQVESATPQLPAQRQGPIVELPQPLRPLPGGVQVQIRDLDIRGNSLIPSPVLRGVVAARLERPLDMAGLREITDLLAAHYAERGYPFVRVYQPEQDLASGVLQLVVVEGRYGAVRILPAQNPAQGLQFGPEVQPVIESFLSGIRLGEYIEGRRLERATLLLDDLPGVKVTPIIQPGQALGTGDLVVRYQRTRPLSAEVGVDNQGSRFTGARRAKLDLTWNSPFTFGDQLRLTALRSTERLNLGSLTYSRLLHGSGLRWKASYAYTDYVLGKDYASLQRAGVAKIASLGLSYPWLRSQANNLTFSLTGQHKTFFDDDGLALTREPKTSRSFPLSAQFDFRDPLLGGGINYGYVTVTRGELMLAATALPTDNAGPLTQGYFTKTEVDVSRLQALPGTLSLSLRWYQQLTSRKNLDASEGVSFGGPSGVRAYPVGEGSGDKGRLLQVELRHTTPDYVGFAFYDQARVKLNAIVYDSTDNRRDISGAGFGLRSTRSVGDGHTLNAEMSLAWSTGGGAPQSDGLARAPRVWLSAGYRY